MSGPLPDRHGHHAYRAHDKLVLRSLRGQRGWKTALIFAAPALLLFTSSSSCRSSRQAAHRSTTGTALARRRPTSSSGSATIEQLLGNKTFQRALGNTGLMIAASLLIQLPHGARHGHAACRPAVGDRRLPDDLLSALHPRRDRDRPAVPLHVRRRRWADLDRRGNVRRRAASPAGRQGPVDHRHPGRGDVEVFRLPHDALHRRHAGHRHAASTRRPPSMAPMPGSSSGT